MSKRAIKIFASTVFGKDYLDGYYSAPNNMNGHRKNENGPNYKNYVFSTVFPSRTMMDYVLSNTDVVQSNLK